jgi:hypothetical protein
MSFEDARGGGQGPEHGPLPLPGRHTSTYGADLAFEFPHRGLMGVIGDDTVEGGVLPLALLTKNRRLVKTICPPRMPSMKVVGKRRLPDSPEESLRRAERLIAEANFLASHLRPRGFVFKAKTWAAYEEWKREQTNPRLW